MPLPVAVRRRGWLAPGGATGGFTWRSDPRTKLPLEGMGPVADLLSQNASTAKLPVLGMFVRDSSVSTPRCKEFLRSVFPRTRMVELGHSPHLETPDVVADLIAAFFRETAPSPITNHGVKEVADAP